MDPIVVIGSGLAGYSLIREIRKLDASLPIQLVTMDDGTYYSKPQLSSAFTNHKTAEKLAGPDFEKMMKQLHIEVLPFHKAIFIDKKNKQIHCEQLQQNNSIVKLPYSSLVLAQGAKVISANLNQHNSPRILSINNLMDYKKFRELCENKKNIAILGAGLVGCEFANDLHNGGFNVTLIALSKTPLELLLPPELGQVLEQAYRNIGIQWQLETTIEKITSLPDESLQIDLANKQSLQADLLISAIGLKPDIQLAQQTGINTNKGIMVDEYLRTDVSDIYALGDCAEVKNLVMVYVAPLVLSARALAKTLTGHLTAVSYPPMPVILKTPACPIVTNPPLPKVAGSWQFQGENFDQKGLYYDEVKNLCGFALTGHCVNEKMDLVQLLPNYF